MRPRQRLPCRPALSLRSAISAISAISVQRSECCRAVPCPCFAHGRVPANRAKGSFTKKTQELKEAKNKQNLRASLTDADPKIDTEKNTFEVRTSSSPRVDTHHTRACQLPQVQLQQVPHPWCCCGGGRGRGSGRGGGGGGALALIDGVLRECVSVCVTE